MRNSSQNTSPPNYQLGDLLSAGIMFPACIAIGYGIGFLLGKWFGNQKTFEIIFLLFGIAAAFINLFKVISREAPNNDTSKD